MISKLSLLAVVGSTFFLLPQLFCQTSKPATSQKNIFQIGTFDRSSSEFAGGRPTGSIDFLAGISNPRKDWYAA